VGGTSAVTAAADNPEGKERLEYESDMRSLYGDDTY
jgi:hypothetical protein